MTEPPIVEALCVSRTFPMAAAPVTATARELAGFTWAEMTS